MNSELRTSGFLEKGGKEARALSRGYNWTVVAGEVVGSGVCMCRGSCGVWVLRKRECPQGEILESEEGGGRDVLWTMGWCSRVPCPTLGGAVCVCVGDVTQDPVAGHLMRCAVLP